MKASYLKLALKTCIEAKQPVFIWGSPGTGKSNIVAQVTEDIGYNLVDIRALLLDPVDLRGIPIITNGTCTWSIPSFLPTKEKVVIFLDELNAAPQSVQAACYQLILDRKIGEYTLPNDCIIIAAGNNETDRAVTNRMPTPLANRFVHLKLETDLNDWVTWALNNNVIPEVIAFIQLRPDLLNNFDPKTNNKAFCTPRTLFFLSNIIKTKPDKKIEYDLITGVVGEGIATEFIAFLRLYQDLPNINRILVSPDSVGIPNNPSTLYAICTALAYKADKRNFKNIIIYGNKLQKEFSVLLTQNCIRKNKELTKTEAYINWVISNSNILI